jgi:hypothetical protein
MALKILLWNGKDLLFMAVFLNIFLGVNFKLLFNIFIYESHKINFQKFWLMFDERKMVTNAFYFISWPRRIKLIFKELNKFIPLLMDRVPDSIAKLAA